MTEFILPHVSFSVLAGALIIDAVFKELPLAIHPVVWMGKIIEAYKTRFPPTNTHADLLRSLGLTLGLPLLAAGVGFVFSHQALLEAIALSTTLSFGYFRKILLNLLDTFRSGNLEKMRTGVAMLVSRNTQPLSEQELLGAAIETTVENITDAIVAPICFYLLGGLPLAMAYRAVNTLDAMIGYKDKYFFYGKIAARTDDVANFIPARIVAALMFVVAAFRREMNRNVWKVFLRDRNKTDSPNAGQTIAAAAGILGVQLSKRDTYDLGDPSSLVSVSSLEKSIAYLVTTTLSAYAISLAIAAAVGRFL